MEEFLRLLPPWAQTLVLLTITAALVAYLMRDIMEKFNHPVAVMAEQLLPREQTPQILLEGPNIRELLDRLTADMGELRIKVESEVGGLQQRVQFEVARNEREFRRQERIEEEQGRVRTAVERLTARLDVMGERMDEMKGTVDRVEGRMDQMNGTLDKILAHVANLPTN